MTSPHVKSSHSSHWTGYQMARLASPSNRPSASRIVGLGSSQVPHENCYFFEEKTIHQGLLSYYFLIFRYSNIFKAPFGLAMHRSPTKTSAGLWSLGPSHCQQGQQKCTPQKHLGVDVDRPHSFPPNQTLPYIEPHKEKTQNQTRIARWFIIYMFFSGFLPPMGF